MHLSSPSRVPITYNRSFQVALQLSFIHFSIFLVVLGERINLTPVTLSSAKTEVQ